MPVPTDVIDAYSDYLFERDERVPDSMCDFVLINVFGQNPDTPMTYSNVKRIFDRMSRSANTTARPHTLRHTAATTWVNNGASIDVVQQLLGHQSAASTHIYLHPPEEALREAVEHVQRRFEDGRAG